MSEEVLKVLLKSIPQLGATAVLVVWLWNTSDRLKLVEMQLYDCLKQRIEMTSNRIPNVNSTSKMSAVLPRDEFKIKVK